MRRGAALLALALVACGPADGPRGPRVVAASAVAQVGPWELSGDVSPRARSSVAAILSAFEADNGPAPRMRVVLVDAPAVATSRGPRPAWGDVGAGVYEVAAPEGVPLRLYHEAAHAMLGGDAAHVDPRWAAWVLREDELVRELRRR